MNQKLTNWQQELDDEAADEYNALRRSLRRNDGFGLFFVQCSPSIGENIFTEIGEDIKSKRIDILRLTEPIDSLYNLIIDLPNINDIDILFISGLEHSLYEYEQYTFDDSKRETYANSKERYSQSWRGVPRFLGYLNLQRDRFREDFDISFVFLVPSFGIDYFIKRAPDFFDWRSGFFRFIPSKDRLIDFNIDRIMQVSSEQSQYELLDLQALKKELDFSHDEQANLAYKQFFLSMNCQRYEDAVTHVDCWLENKKDDELAWFIRGYVLRQLGRYEEAISSYDKVLEIHPDFDIAWDSRGIALRNLGKYEEAIASSDKALAINPDSDIDWNNRGVALDELGRYEEAISSYDKALEINPDDDLAWLIRGVALDNLGRYEEAISSYDKALEINPDFDMTWNNRGIALGILGRYEEAIASSNKVLEINPEDDKAWNTCGASLDNLGRYEEAISSFDKVLEINPEDNLAWYNRGVSLRKLGKHEEAIASSDKALEINPEDNLAWYNRSVSLFNLKIYKEAIASFDRALEINPDDDKAWYNRGISLFNLKIYEEAIASFDKALEINPNLISILLNDYITLMKSEWQKFIQPLKSFFKKLIHR